MQRRGSLRHAFTHLRGARMTRRRHVAGHTTNRARAHAEEMRVHGVIAALLPYLPSRYLTPLAPRPVVQVPRQRTASDARWDAMVQPALQRHRKEVRRARIWP